MADRSGKKPVIKPLFLLSLVSLGLVSPGADGPDRRDLNSVPPRPWREFRGAWVATVSNLDWPSRPGLTTAEQQAELVAILDKAVQLRLNAIIFQVRPACDAFYSSSLEPWSEYLTGQMGRAPEPFYDPLDFAIDQAHQRGLELHAWFNPYRARQRYAKSSVAANHISRLQPHLVRKFGKYLWLDPGEPDVQEHSTSVILDVLRRYDVDGIHLDDYFYPYPDEQVKTLDFPDEPSWRRYVARGGRLQREAWRRKNVDEFIQLLYRRIKAEKAWVKFGISPFGIWRPGYPQEVTGLDAYAQLYADSRRWLMNGWLDYCAPQLYWAIQPPGQSYPALLHWWTSQNVKNRHVWPGNNSTKVGSAWKAEEILNQVRMTRRQPGASGNVFWNMSSLAKNPDGLGDALLRELYFQPALVPAFPWLDARPPAKPKVLSVPSEAGEVRIVWEADGPEPVWLWIVQTRSGGEWRTEVLPRKEMSRQFAPFRNRLPELVAITAVDRTGNTGPTALLSLTKSVARSGAGDR
jgi:uncharacterized lipoprotein YddW (UPF0748 family)